MATFEGNWFAYEGDRWLEEQEGKDCEDEGLRNISSGTGDYTAGDEVRPSTEGFCQ